MKATDLMIGDWVKDETMDYPSKEKNYIVKGIYSAPDGMFAQIAENDSDSVFHVTCEVLEPIELTEKILEKNGLESYSHESNLIWGIKTAEGHWVLAYMDYYWEFTMDATIYRRIKIRYVHELQHALKLCGIEKEIEL